MIVTKTKRKLKIGFGLILAAAVILFFRNETIEEAMTKANIRFNEIVYETEYSDSIIIFYRTNDILSTGQLQQNLLGYQWIYGSGSSHFREEDDATWSITNFTRTPDSQNNISIAKGIVNDPEIQEMTIHFKDEDVVATFIDYGGVRIWYAFSKAPIPGMPDVTMKYMDGTTKSGWY